MWLWQHKSVRRRHLLWLKLCGLSAAFHGIFFFFLFFIYRDASFAIALTIRRKLFNKTASVIFVSLPEQKEQLCVIPKIASMQSVATTITKKTKIISKKQVKIKKQVVSKVQYNKEIKQKHDNHKTDAKPKKIIQADAQPKAIQIFAHYKEVEAYRRYTLFQKKLLKYWHPPIGASQDCMCEIEASIGCGGAIQKLDIITSSGVLMYDISAQSSLYAMNMPIWVCGRSLLITFKQ